ncbi:MAG: putative membrane protein [Myxococcota bacterium]|jgi:putative membrane protein
MHVGQRYKFTETLYWSRRDVIVPLVWATITVVLYDVVGLTFLSIPWLPMSLLGVAVAFYLGFKNNASYDRLWEARKIWGAIVNASRSWAFTSRDMLSGDADDAELDAIRRELVLRHVAWMDALRHQLRKIKSWEHQGPVFDSYRKGSRVPEYIEDLPEVLRPNLPPGETEAVTAMLNPAAHLLSNQSRRLADLRARGLLDGFSHLVLQQLLHELMTQQGKAERIKNFPFPRQYATVNSFFAIIFAVLVPFGMLEAFAAYGGVWLTIPFSALVSWVFLTTDRIGDWSENPFEGLANDVPITSMARGIERDIRQMDGQSELPDAREPHGMFLF